MFDDGGTDLSQIQVAIASIDFSCADLRGRPPAGPGYALVLYAMSTDGGSAKGTFTSNGSNINLVELNPDGGTPVAFETISAGTSTFSLIWNNTISEGVAGSLDLTLADGGTIQGAYAASACE
jgi:hypothetical protein